MVSPSSAASMQLAADFCALMDGTRKRRHADHDDEYEDYYGGKSYDDYDYGDYSDYHHGGDGRGGGDLIYRDEQYLGVGKVVRNPRDHRNFPGVVPAGIDGISPKLFRFITTHVNEVSYFVQGGARRKRR